MIQLLTYLLLFKLYSVYFIKKKDYSTVVLVDLVLCFFSPFDPSLNT